MSELERLKAKQEAMSRLDLLARRALALISECKDQAQTMQFDPAPLRRHHESVTGALERLEAFLR